MEIDPFQDQQEQTPVPQTKPARAPPLPPHTTQRLFQPDLSPTVDPFRDTEIQKSHIIIKRPESRRQTFSELLEERQISNGGDLSPRRKRSESHFPPLESPTKSLTGSIGSENPFQDQGDYDGYSSSSTNSPVSSVFVTLGRPTTTSTGSTNMLGDSTDNSENPFESNGNLGPPVLPPRGSNGNGPPPLPNRPPTAVNHISEILASKLVLKQLDEVKIPDTASAYRSPPVANYLPVSEITLKGHSRISAFCGYYAVSGTSNV